MSDQITIDEALGDWDAADIVGLRRMVPDPIAVITLNPLADVFFRAGLLACRETMARFVEQGGTEIEKTIANSIRANWWPSLGPDPGKPRQVRYDEVADEKPDGSIAHKAMDASVEALPRAFAFVLNRGIEPVDDAPAPTRGDGR